METFLCDAMKIMQEMKFNNLFRSRTGKFTTVCLLLMLVALPLPAQDDIEKSVEQNEELQIIKDPRNTVKAVVNLLDEKGMLDKSEIVTELQKIQSRENDTLQPSAGIANLRRNQGDKIAFAGLIVVFVGLILIASTIHLFNKIFAKIGPGNRPPETAGVEEPEGAIPTAVAAEPIPDDILAAIAVAIETYRRLHFDVLESQVTFKTGQEQSAWKVGFKYGQR